MHKSGSQYVVVSIKGALLLFFGLYCILHTIPLVFADPSSETYELRGYNFGSGGLNNGTSETYSLYGISGQAESGQLGSETYNVNGGLVYVLQATVPPAPDFSNPTGANYDRLLLIINNGGNPSDTVYAVAISDDDFVTTKYIKSDYTVGTTLSSSDWLPYSGAGSWGGSSGVYITGLQQNTTYKVKVKAQEGQFTESAWGPTDSATTSTPSLSFGVSPGSVTFSNLNPGNSFTDSSQTSTLTTSTNAYNGYIVYAHATGPLTFNSNTIADFSAPNSAPTTWSGIGFGYSTNDTDLSGGSANRFSGGKYAGFTTSTPGDPVADHAGPVYISPITDEQFTITYRVTANNTTPAGQYTTTLNYVVVPIY